MTIVKQTHLEQLILEQDREDLFEDVYGGPHGASEAFSRVSGLIEKCDFVPTDLFSAPGRTELGGNHTDHNLGKVLCAAVQNDTLAAVRKRDDGRVCISSAGYSEKFEISVSDLTPRPSESGKTESLIRGVLAGFQEAGGQVGGFSADITSNVGVGSGLSSSASFEVLIGTIVNSLYNATKFRSEKIAMIGQFAENSYFGKPCGLMDQTASAVGGIIRIDFEQPTSPEIQKVKFDLANSDFELVVVTTDSNHTDLTSAYASIPSEMKLIARELGSETLREQSELVLFSHINQLRNKHGDRAVLRALHFFSENDRVDLMVAALEASDLDAYLELVSASGASSQNVLQNTVPPGGDGTSQGLGFALGVSQHFFEKAGRGVARVHGGGFAGTIQAYVHSDDLLEYQKLMTGIYGQDAMQQLHLRQSGARQILSL